MMTQIVNRIQALAPTAARPGVLPSLLEHLGHPLPPGLSRFMLLAALSFASSEELGADLEVPKEARPRSCFLLL